MQREPGELDRAVLAMITEECSALASVQQVWTEGAQMWITHVRPHASGAAPMSVGVEGYDALNVTAGNIWFELFGDVRTLLPSLRDIVRAVVGGHLEEAGRPSSAFGRIGTSAGPMRVGALSLPVPWRLRRRRRYAPYSDAPR